MSKLLAAEGVKWQRLGLDLGQDDDLHHFDQGLGYVGLLHRVLHAK